MSGVLYILQDYSGAYTAFTHGYCVSRSLISYQCILVNCVTSKQTKSTIYNSGWMLVKRQNGWPSICPWLQMLSQRLMLSPSWIYCSLTPYSHLIIGLSSGIPHPASRRSVVDPGGGVRGSPPPPANTTFLWHLYNVEPTSKTLDRRCTNAYLAWIFHKNILWNSMSSKLVTMAPSKSPSTSFGFILRFISALLRVNWCNFTNTS